MQGDFGEPRPALVIQAHQFVEHATVTVLPTTSMLVVAPLLRITVQPSAENGLLKPSQVMVDKAMTVRRWRLSVAWPYSWGSPSNFADQQQIADLSVVN